MQYFQKTDRIFISDYDNEKDKSNLKDYISSNFQIPDNDLDMICNFIKKDIELENLVLNLYDLATLKVGSVKGMQIKFYPEFQEDELILMIEILSDEDVDFDTLLDLEKKLNHELLKLYPIKTLHKTLIYFVKYFLN